MSHLLHPGLIHTQHVDVNCSLIHSISLFSLASASSFIPSTDKSILDLPEVFISSSIEVGTEEVNVLKVLVGAVEVGAVEVEVREVKAGLAFYLRSLS